MDASKRCWGIHACLQLGKQTKSALLSCQHKHIWRMFRFSDNSFLLMSLPSIFWGEPRASLLFSFSSFPLGLSFLICLPSNWKVNWCSLSSESIGGGEVGQSCSQPGRPCSLINCGLPVDRGCFILITEDTQKEGDDSSKRWFLTPVPDKSRSSLEKLSCPRKKKKKKWEQDTDQCSCMHSASRLFWVTLAQLLAAHWHRQTYRGLWSHSDRTLVC